MNAKEEDSEALPADIIALSGCAPDLAVPDAASEMELEMYRASSAWCEG